MTKKSIIITVLIFVIGFTSGFFARPALAYDYNVQVEVNDKMVKFDQKPYIDKVVNRTYVPIRFVAEEMGAIVGWDQATETVSITKNNDRICLQIGSKVPTINSVPMAKALDAPARLQHQRTYVPLRFLSETMGQNVLWDKYNNLVRISDKPFVATDELTATQKQRLMAYAYPKDQQGKEYEIDDRMVEMKEWFKTNGRSTKDVLVYMMTPIDQFKVLKPNQKLITDADLCYYVHNPLGSNRIRGILQTYESDGTVTEQDIEYGFDYGQHFVSAGQPQEPNHWFSEYDTKPLSAKKTVQ